MEVLIIGSKTDEKLFEPEQEVLQAAIDDISNTYYANDKLMPRYEFLTKHYKKLLKVTRKIFHISDIQGHVLQQHQIEIQNLLDNANQGFLTFGQDLNVSRLCSAESVRIFGRKIAGIPIIHLLGQENEHMQKTLRKILERVFSAPVEQAITELKYFPGNFHIHNKNIRVECKVIPQPDFADERTVIMMILTDITEQLKSEAKILYLSYHDKLTSLYNRAYVEEILPQLEQEEALPLSVIMSDMNGLKLVNDVFGHQQGDALLVTMADVLKKSCRQTDVIIRWGGDEFLILLPNTDQDTCEKICERIGSACGAVDFHSIPLSLAIGMVTKEKGKINLTELFSIAENRMYSNKLIESKKTRKIIIAKFEENLVQRCFENMGHSDRVKKLAISFVDFLKTDTALTGAKQLEKLAQFHDIGKVAIPAEILGSTRALTLDEWDVIKSHSEIGYRMMQSIGEHMLADIILALHERWDGSGYPCGLAGEEIPYIARMFTIVDCYDIITHERSYKKALDKASALKEIEAGMGTQFDPNLVKHFISYMNAQ